MKDRLVAGGLAGMIAGLIEYAYGLIMRRLGFTDRILSNLAYYQRHIIAIIKE